MTDYSTTHSSTVAGHPIHDLADKLTQRLRQIRRRWGFKNLLDLDDHMLDDIGVQRHEVEYASRLPLSVNAATELRRISLERRRTRP